MNTNRQIAAEKFKAYDAEDRAFLFGEWANLDIATRNARQAEIDRKHGYRHGWIQVNGEGFDRERAFPDQFFARFPADQGCSD